MIDIGQIDISGTSGLTWLDDETLVLSRVDKPEDPASPVSLSTLDIRTGAQRGIGLPSLDGCQRTDYLRPERLPDGRIGAVQRCIPNGPSGGDWPTRLIAMDPDTKSVEQLTPNLSSGSVVNVSAYSWRPDMREATVSVGSRICQRLVTATEVGLVPIDKDVTVAGKTFNLGDPVNKGNDCSSTGRADQPTWSPDGANLAFLASAAAIGLSGTDRLAAPSSLLLQQAGASDPLGLLDGVQDAVGLRYSPSGECLGFGANLTGQGNGTFLVRPSDGKLVKVSDTGIGASWSPSGEYLAGAVRPRSGEPLQWLVVLPASCDLLAQ
ncbi:MAG TPA: hypothetical protein VFV72_12970 [Candidatus Limnocylindrales bacterium]|nr:hypothetical protein [Candidatus Limnocylindrales bacterium]